VSTSHGLAQMMMVAMGLLVTLYVGKQLLADKTPPPRRIGTRTVPMLVGDVEVGTVLTADHIGMGPWPANEIKGDVLLGQSAIVGRVVRKSLKAAEPIHGSDLFPMNELPPLTVSDGYRAMTIHLADAAAVMNGLLRPGDHVDIEFTPRTNVTSDPRYQEIGGLSIVLFKGVRILAFNRAFVQSDLESSGNNVTLEVAQNDVAVLRLADENGDLYLSYTPDANGSMTVAVANPDRPTLEELLQLPPLPEEPVAPQPDVFRSRIYNGTSRGYSQTFVNGVPTGGSGNFGGYGGNGNNNGNQNNGQFGYSGSYQGPVNGSIRYGYQNGANGLVNPGFVPGPGMPNGAVPYNGGGIYGPQTSTGTSGAPSSQNVNSTNSGYRGIANRTASAR
jgi:pilus assembly protein CpaB